MSELVRMEDIHKHFPLPGKKVLNALNGITLSIEENQVLGIVGESGCGKSTLAKILMGILAQDKGHMYYKGEELFLKSHAQRKAYSQKAQMVFQNPYASLNPKLKAREIVGEGLIIHGKYEERRVLELFNMVGLREEYMGRSAHEFSGGQRQRLGIARALALNPEFLVCDEPISALDISIQSQIVNLLCDLQKEMGLTLVFIAHDLNIVRYISHKIAVLYLVHIVELGNKVQISTKPMHPYTQILLNAVLSPQVEENKLDIMPHMTGEIQNPLLPILGCPFACRCPHGMEQCKKEKPPLKEVEKNHFLACFLDSLW